MSKLMKCKKAASAFGAKVDQKGYRLQKGQRIIYEKEEAEIISVKPLLVIKTKNQVICGALEGLFEYI